MSAREVGLHGRGDLQNELMRLIRQSILSRASSMSPGLEMGM